jgi:hypothetical protein
MPLFDLLDDFVLIVRDFGKKNRSRTMIVSPACTGSFRVALISVLAPLTSRMMRTRDVEPRSLTPPARDIACRTDVSRWIGYRPGLLTCPNT